MSTELPTTLPSHLASQWEGRVDPRTRPSFCEKQARKTPETPWHNGATTCSACGVDLGANPLLLTRKSKQERLIGAAFIEEATMLLEALGAKRNESLAVGILGAFYPLVLDTKAGFLLAHVRDDCVNMRFADVERAKQYLPHRSGDALNPYSGKWNVGHFEPEHSLATRLAFVRAHLSTFFTEK